MPDQPLWTPSEKRKSSSNLRRFMNELEGSCAIQLRSYADILNFSTENSEAFWSKLWEFCGVKAETRGKRILIDGEKMPGGRFFPDAKLNYTENLLKRNDDTPALIFWGEDKIKITMTWAELNARVAQTHRVPSSQPAIESDAELARIREAMPLLMAGGARDGLICGETLIVKQYATERRAEVGREIGGGRVVLSEDGIDEKRHRQDRGGVVE